MPVQKRRHTDQQQQLIDEITKSAASFKPLKDRRQLRRFIGEYYRNLSVEDVRGIAAAELARAALGHLNAARRLPPDTYKLDVFNASIDKDGWQSQHTTVQLVHRNMPFLVDSLSMTLDRLGYAIQLTIHPLIRCDRTAKGQFRRVIAKNADTGSVESFIRFEITRETRPERLQEIRDAIDATLTDVRAAVADWPAMRDRMQACIDALEQRPGQSTARLSESIELLRWLADDRFTFLGFREYRLDDKADTTLLRPVRGSALGVNAVGGRRGRSHPLTRQMQKFRRSADILLITKANSRSTVHRESYLDYIGVKTFDDQGKAVGELRFVGLLTSQAYSEIPGDIPLVRGKIKEIVDRSGLDPTGHRGKALIHILNNYPRDELFQASVSDLTRTTTGILNLQDRRRVKLFLRRDTFRRFYSCLVFVPREKYNTEVREKTERILTDALEASTVQSTVQVSDSALARVHLLVYASADRKPHISIRGIESAINDAVITWRDRLREGLIDYFDQQRGADLYESYGRIFPLAYEEDNQAAQACRDLEKLERELNGDTDPLNNYELQLADGDDGLEIRFRVLCLDEPIALSDALPLLENLGMRVINERPYQLRLPERRAWIQEFELAPQIAVEKKQLAQLTDKFAQGFASQLDGTTETDGYNRLIIAASLDSRRVTLVRAYAKYLMQLGLPFSQSYMEDLLCQHHQFIARLVDWFEARFSGNDANAKRRTRKLDAKLQRDLRDASSLDADRALRALLSAMRATVRCNFFWRDTDGQAAPSIAFKIETSRLDEAPLPRPKHEIFVYSPRVEGVHLRAGDVARGGLRWSDRREDFRTEVLGLMKAQTVKNTVIVPTGAKGGFYPKQMPNGSRDEVMAEVTACYKIFINALLSLTDNIVDGRIVGPQGIVCYDGPDPYLVVAADKGTATFSDTANAIAIERGFWLGDAFASGGSAGYDHKKMAITARGAWEAVRRHFREIGVDTQNDTFTVTGIGDMSGDVFGNGMLLSETLRLQAAFNHQHIFIDPDPDAKTSFAERKRLFEMPRSSWTDYDTGLLSAGGGIFERKAKSIPLSSQMKKMLGADADEMSPYDLIRHILRMPVDLLWNGGIGTYVKASGESHSDVGDRHNDNLRVDADMLRCKVVGEGGNLGLTQLARVEFALKGGRLNTDFIDNSAGVDSSDREVNIKILLRLAASKTALSNKARNRLLAEMTDDVADLVLRNNYLQTQAISMMDSNAKDRLSEHRGLIEQLERSGLLNRSLEHLPDDETLDERKRNHKGLTRPEISVILSYSKLDLYQRLIGEQLPTTQEQAIDLMQYFPRALQKKYGDLIPAHELGNEIITTLLTNSIVNRMGPVFPTRTEQDTGYSIGSVARSYEIARDITGAREIWQAIEALDTRIPTNIQYAMMFEVARKLRHACYHLLRAHEGVFSPTLSKNLTAPVRDVLSNLGELMADSGRARLRESIRRHSRMGVPDKLATRVSELTFVNDVLLIVTIAEQRNCATDVIARVYFLLGQRLQIDWVRQAIDNLKVEGRWQARARGTLRDNAIRAQRDLTGQVHSLNQCKASAASIEELIDSDRESFSRVDQLITQMRENKSTDFATLTVAVDEFKQLTLKLQGT